MAEAAYKLLLVGILGIFIIINSAEAQGENQSVLNGKRNAQIYTGYLKFIYVNKMNSFSHRKSTNIYKIMSDIQTADSFDSIYMLHI